MKKNARYLFLFCVLCLCVQNSPAAERTEITIDENKKAVIVSDSPVSEELLQKITNALTAVWNIPGLQGNSANVLIDPTGGFRFVLYPTELVYNGTDLIPYLPSGMAFYYTTALFYDITMKVNEYAPKVTGLFVSAEDLLKNMFAATVMPDMYMFDNYLLNRVSRLEKALMAQSKKSLFNKATAVNEEIILAIRGYYNENPNITRKEAEERLKQSGIKATKADVNAVFLVLLGKTE